MVHYNRMRIQRLFGTVLKGSVALTTKPHISSEQDSHSTDCFIKPRLRPVHIDGDMYMEAFHKVGSFIKDKRSEIGNSSSQHTVTRSHGFPAQQFLVRYGVVPWQSFKILLLNPC
jgi:hypothetical protein